MNSIRLNWISMQPLTLIQISDIVAIFFFLWNYLSKKL